MFQFWHDAAMLAIESQRVVALRMMRFAGGGRNARVETSRMMTEKISASLIAAGTLLGGGSGHVVMAQVRKRVRANSRRLSRG